MVAATLVFVAVYTYFYHESKMEPVPWENGLIEVEGIESRPYSDVFDGEAPSDSSESTIDVLVLKYDEIINGIQESMFKDNDGTVTEILQGWSSKRGGKNLTKDYNEMAIYPVPDRLLYSGGRQQQLLWGEPMNSGVEALPRLALAYYSLLAAGLAPCIFAGKKRSLAKREAVNVLEMLGIIGLANREVKKLSGGQKQRTAIARAIINRPNLILADEPTGALDSKNADMILQVLLSLVNEQSIVILATHDAAAAQRCNHILRIKDGKII